MSEVPNVDQAMGWLTEQLGALNRLRNGSPRSAEFKQWRQSTLTAAQRIWPNDEPRSERFRRIPFSPSSTKADDHATRAAFERGCSEAKRIIRLWIAEIKHHGIERSEPAEAQPPSGADAGPADEAKSQVRLKEMLGLAPPLPAASGLPQVPEYLVPDAREVAKRGKRKAERSGALIPLAPQPTGGSRGRRGASPPAQPSEPRRSDPAASSAPPPPVRAETPAQSAQPPAPAARARTPEPAPKPVPGPAPKAVPGPAPKAAPRSMTPAAAPAPGPAPPEERADPPIAAASIEPGAKPPPSLGDMLGLSLTRAFDDAQRDAPAPAETPAPVASSPVDPVLAQVADELAALAPELEALGVSAPDREPLRRLVLETAASLRSGALDWESLRGAIGILMAHPPLARRALPLLVPFLDRAA